VADHNTCPAASDAGRRLYQRREFITLLGGAVAWPVAARAQAQPMPRIGVLMNRAASDLQGQARVAAFKEGMQQLGWSEGRNVQIDIRWGEDDVDLEQKNAAELIALAPEVIFASGTLSVAALRRLDRNVPIVFANVTDPLGAGFVDSLNRPGRNTTGLRDAGGCYKKSRQSGWDRFIRCYPGRGTVPRSGGKPGRQSPRCPRH
jgi:putative tryptophan/tyrosine transport system substrate-binding protein